MEKFGRKKDCKIGSDGVAGKTVDKLFLASLRATLARRQRNLFKVAFCLAGVAFAFGFSGCKEKSGGAKAEPKKVMRVAYLTGGLCGAPLHYAINSGLLADELSAVGYGLEVVEVVSGGLSQAELIAAGKVDAGFELISSTLLPMENGLKIVFTTGVHTGCTKYYVKGDSPINSVADLKGKTVGVPSLSDSSVINLKRAAFRAGISVNTEKNELEFVQYGMSDLPIALNNGAVDAIGIHDPVATIGEENYGFKKILDTGTDEYLKNEYCCQIFVTTDFYKNHPEATAAWTRASEKASAFVRAEPREAAKMQLDNDLVSGELEFNTRLLKELNYEPNLELGRETLVRAARDLKDAGILKPTTDVDKFLSEHYAIFDNVPNSYVYDSATQTYKEVWE